MRDVIVIGGGPVGSRVAGQLAGAGHSVTVLERGPEVGRKACCTGIVSRECATAFSIPNDVVLSMVSGARLFSPSGDGTRLWRPQAQACVLDRPAFDAAMARQAQDRGAEYVFDSPAGGVSIEKDKASVRVLRGGKPVDFEGRVVVVANGFSRLTERLGLGRIGDFALGAQAVVETEGSVEIEVYFGRDIAPGFFAWLVPTTSGTARVGLLSHDGPGPYLRKLISSLQRRGKIVRVEAVVSYGAVPLRPLRRTYGERLIVVGDAAGQVKPTTGGGIYYGLLCADMAANTLHQALEAGDTSSRRLARYEKDWRRKLGEELKVDHWARRLFERLDDAQLDHAFQVAENRGIVEALLKAPDLSFDWHSKAVLKLMGYRAMSAAVGVLKLPFQAD